MATHSNILACKIPWTEDPGGLLSMEFMQSHTWLSTRAHTHTHTYTHTQNTILYFAMFSVQFSGSVMSDSLWPHGLHHARPPCPLVTPGVYSNSCPWVLLMQYFTILKFNMMDLNQSHTMCVCVCVCVVTKSFWFFCNPMDCSPPGSSVHGISQAGILEWVSISSSSHI